MHNFRLGYLIFIGSLFLAPYGFAQKSTPSKWTYDQNIETFFEYSHVEVRNQNLNNLNNRVLELPSHTGLFQVRPDMRLSTERTKLVLRPQWTYQHYIIELDKPTYEKSYGLGKAQLNDLFVENLISDNWTTVVGLQVYQWGPAEIMNPSNPLFTFSREQRGLYFKEKGKVLARANWSPTPNWSLMLILEPLTNGEAQLREGEKFAEKGLVKGELRSDDSLNYFGVVAGTEREHRTFFGEYFNYTPWDGFSFYADARHPKGYKAWIPARNIFNVYEMRDDQLYVDDGLYTIAVAGIRWEAKYDFRLEYIHNGVGWDKTAFKNAKTSITQLSPFIISNFAKFYRPGFDLMTEKYLYTSLRIPDIGKKADRTLYFFDIHSLADNSGVFQASFDIPLTDAVVLYTEGSVNYGDDDSEFKLFSDNTVRLGTRIAF